MMKKVFCVLLAIILPCMYATAEPVGVTGTWYLNQLQTTDQTICLTVTDVEASLTLREDNAFVLTTEFTDGTTEKLLGQWALENETVILSIDGETEMEMTLNGDDLLYSHPEMDIVFTFGRERIHSDFSASPITAADVAGRWDMSRMLNGWEDTNFSESGISISIMLYENGTFVLYDDDNGTQNEQLGTWTPGNGTVHLIFEDIAPIDLVLNDDKLVLVSFYHTEIYVFSRDKVELSTDRFGTESADLSIEDFDGRWTAVLMEMDGDEFYLSDVGGAASAELSGGKATISIQFSATAEPVVIELNCELVDGMLIVPEYDSNDTALPAVTLKLDDNGMMAYTNEIATMYFVKDVQ